MTAKFDVVATGGTFDEIHVGHIALLRKAFEVGSMVIIGVSSDRFAEARGKSPTNSYERRVAKLESAIKGEFGNVHYEIAKLDAQFGPAVSTGAVDALICSEETKEKGKILNEIRIKNRLKPVSVIVINLVTADDGGKVSSSRIKAGEIDKHGRIVSTSRRG